MFRATFSCHWANTFPPLPSKDISEIGKLADLLLLSSGKSSLLANIVILSIVEIILKSTILQSEKPPIDRIDSQESQLSREKVWRRR